MRDLLNPEPENYSGFKIIMVNYPHVFLVLDS